MKKTIHSFWLILLLTLLPLAFASASETPPANEISSNISSSFIEWFNPLRSNDYAITYVSSGIDVVNGKLYITGTTEVNAEMPIVGGYAAIQRWDGTKWTTYKSFYFDKYDTNTSKASTRTAAAMALWCRLFLCCTFCAACASMRRKYSSWARCLIASMRSSLMSSGSFIMVCRRASIFLRSSFFIIYPSLFFPVLQAFDYISFA